MLGFKPQPLNYAAQAEAAMRKLAPLAVANFESEEARILIWLADQIRDAVHFIMPEDGHIFDDRLKGIMGSEAHLPYPSITLEYYSNRDPGVSTEGTPLYKATKRVLLAKELSLDEFLFLAKRFWGGVPQKYVDTIAKIFGDGVIFVTGVFYINYEIPVWSPSYAAWLLPINAWYDPTGPKIDPLRDRGVDRMNPEGGISGRPMPIFPRAYLEMLDRMGADMTDRYIANDIGVEAFVVLELIEALSCSNVRIGTLQSVKPGVNERRIRDGKLPLYETKILTVNVSTKDHKEARGALTGERASPGEHLRRGHIQSYRTKQGVVNLWKQKIVVSAGNPRIIRKSYKLKKGV